MTIEHDLRQPLNRRYPLPLRYDPPGLNEWLTLLPKANAVESGRLLDSLIKSLKKHEFSQKTRYANLNVISEQVEHTCATLRNKYLDDLQVSAEAKQALFYLAQQLHKHLISEYISLLKREDDDLLPKERNSCLARALQYLTELMLRHYQTYRHVDASLWQNFYELYRIAESEQSLSQLVFGVQLKEYFQRALLLATSSLYQLHSKEMSHLMKHLHEWAHWLSIDDQLNTNHRLFISLDSNTPPYYQEQLLDQQQTANLRGINYQRLIQHLQPIAASSNEPSMNHLIDHLLYRWRQYPQRQYPRQTIQEWLDVCLGLVNTYYVVNHESSLINIPNATSRTDPTQLYTQQPSSRESSSVEHLDTDDVSQLLNGNAHHLASYHRMSSWYEQNSTAANATTKQNHAQPDTPKSTPFHWQWCNHHLNGGELNTVGEYPEGLMIGNIIATFGEDNPEANFWCIAVIRWLKRSSSQKVLVGFNILSSQAGAIGLQNRQQHHEEDHFARGLLLPENAHYQNQPTIITPSLPYQAGDKLRMVNSTIDDDIHLGECIEQTPFYCQFTFDVLKRYRPSS